MYILCYVLLWDPTIILGLVYDFGVSSFEVEKGSISTISGVKSVLPMVSCSANFV